MLRQVYRLYKRVQAKRDATEVGPRGPDMVDMLQGEAGTPLPSTKAVYSVG